MIEEVQKILGASEIAMRDPLYVYTASIEGFALKLSDEEAEALKQNEAVLSLCNDQIITLARPVPNPKPMPQQITPWGIERVGGPQDGTGKVAWIIDTGIDLDHPDLNVDRDRGETFVPKTGTADDDYGHGTHCAGIVAALNNGIGVVGVAAGAAVVPVKVLDRHGSGTLSGVIAGVDYVADMGKSGDAVNMSLGGGISSSLDGAVGEMAKKGLLVALSAGNEADDAMNYSPARVNGPNIFTVSACATGDLWAYFSNYGDPVDYCAPGVTIISTYKGGQFAAMSGTSMAAPHLCGLLLLKGKNVPHDGHVIGDPDGNGNDADPIAHY
jgi:subtilisin family serine protease